MVLSVSNTSYTPLMKAVAMAYLVGALRQIVSVHTCVFQTEVKAAAI
jgi:hypothetical protein